MRRSGFAPSLAGIVFILILGVLVVVMLPAGARASRQPSARACAQHPGECASAAEPGAAPGQAAGNEKTSWSRGRDMFVAEGCASCHTQQVRPIAADVGLGPASIPGDYALDDPPHSDARYGPDLSNVGLRSPFTGCEGTAKYLENPRSLRPWSPMPAYAHLGGQDLIDLATYITHLRPASASGPATCDGREQGTPAASAPTASGGGG